MRHPKWEQRLQDYIASVFTEPHEYGQHDCLLHCGRAAEAVDEVDRHSVHAGKYDSHAKAHRHLRKLGFNSYAELLDSMFPRKPIGFAQRGDIILCEDDNGTLIPGICLAEFAVIAGEGDHVGLQRVPMERWKVAWGVGHE